MKKIDGRGKSLRELLSGARYAIDYYQREYKWETKQVKELLDDLSQAFLEDHDERHERTEVEKYGHYFLGSIIISQRDGQNYIIDGQQRLTTLTLLLVFLQNLQKDRKDRVEIKDLIFSERYGRRSFNLDVDEREPCMDALYRGEPFEIAEAPESVQTIAARYRDIETYFPPDLADKSLPYFIDWLVDNVHLVEITATSDEDAYSVFETMNDRGLSLSPTDMLKGYLLARTEDPKKRQEAGRTWRKEIEALRKVGREEEADFFKAWLRARYARKIRERKKGAQPEDYDRIGTEFHRWVRENEKQMGLARTDDFFSFIQKDLSFYARHYRRLREAAERYLPALSGIFHLEYLGFTLQYPVFLSPLAPEDSDEAADRKIRIVAAYLEALLARRIWRWKSIASSTMQYAIFLLMRDIRGLSVDDLRAHLRERLSKEVDPFTAGADFGLHQMNRPAIHWLLARMTDQIEQEAGRPSRIVEYLTRDRKTRYEVEHIWADAPDDHRDEFPHPVDFRKHRNRIGGLLLIPKKVNASYGALPYQQKRKHYIKQNLLAASLLEETYERDPGFRDVVKATGLPFRPHPSFVRADLDARQDLYIRLAEHVWNESRIDG